MGAYGVAAASLLYFDKSVHELSVAEAAYLAALPKAPNNYHPFRQRERALERRNYVIDRMAEDHYISAQEADKAKKEPLKITLRPTGAHIFAAEYFAEEVRRYIYDNFTEKKLYEGGLSVRTTLDPKMQVLARKVLVDGFVNFDEQQGYRGAIQKLDPAGDWGIKLADVKALSDIGWRLAIVLEADDASARIGLQPGREPGGVLSKQRETGTIALEGAKWAKPTSGPTRGKAPTKVSQVLAAGDVVYVEPLAAFPTTRASSTAPRRRCANRAPRSSRSSTPPPSTMATRPRPSYSMRRSRSTPAPASGRRRTTPRNTTARRRCGSA